MSLQALWGAGKNRRPYLHALTLIALALGAAACKKTPPPQQQEPQTLSPEEQGTPPSNPAIPPVRRPTPTHTRAYTPAEVAQGKAVYQANCTSCHNADPKKPGSVGPDLYGTERDVLEARLVRNAYPPMYRPKRSTHLMPPLPQLAKEIDALEAYLNSSTP